MRAPLLMLAALVAALGSFAPASGAGRETVPVADAVAPAEPNAKLAAALLDTAAPLALTREEAAVPLWRAAGPEGLAGYIASTWEVAGSIGYSGRPIDILVAVSPQARIAGARLMRQSEPVLTLGISEDDIAAYVDGFAGVDLTRPVPSAFEAREDVPQVIARATVSTGVIRDAILRTARTVALGRGLIPGPGRRIDRVGFEQMDWDALVAIGAIATTELTLDEAQSALAGARVAVPAGAGAFLGLALALIDPPTIGRSLLGQQGYTAATARLGPGDAAILVASHGVFSHRGTRWRRSGVFERIEVIQGARTIALTADDYLRVDGLALDGAPEFKEISVFRVAGPEFDPAVPFRIEVTASRPAASGGTVSTTVPLAYRLPERFLLEPEQAATETPVWVEAWERRRATVVGVGAMLLVLTGVLFFQEALVRRPRLWRVGRLAFLSVTLLWLGVWVGGQLSVVQVVAFVQALLSGFRWETFLIEPVIFLLWAFVALGLLFWGRGVYCGWLCPFGAAQELLSALAQRLGVPQVSVPFAVQERLWVIKYTLFVAILGLSLHSMEQALILAEAEPFKTAVSMLFQRAWPFVAFAVAVLAMGLFVERFYCRYLCPLGAGLAIPAKIKLFDWLHRRPQCGRECRLCETKCTVGAIDPLGRINPNECVLCLRCQVIMNDPATCPVLKRRARATPAGSAP